MPRKFGIETWVHNGAGAHCVDLETQLTPRASIEVARFGLKAVLRFDTVSEASGDDVFAELVLSMY